jgi:NADH dehydrogenase/NADH:ubiquinone oxidoreductase subunit G
MMTIEISGKKYEVPEGITVISDEMMLRHMG